MVSSLSVTVCCIYGIEAYSIPVSGYLQVSKEGHENRYPDNHGHNQVYILSIVFWCYKKIIKYLYPISS